MEFHRGEPRVEEVGAEGQDVLRVREVVGRQRRRAESHPVAGTQRFEAERLVAQVAATHLLHPLSDEIAERRLLGAGQEHDPLALRLAHLGREPLDRAVPIDVFEGAAGVTHHRMRDAIGIVQPLQRGLSARAQPAAIDGGVGIALELDRAALAHAHADTAARRAFPARRGVVRGGPRNLVFGLNQIGDQPLGRLRADAAGGHRGGSRPSDAENFQKAAAID